MLTTASVEGLPTYAQALIDHGNLSTDLDEMQSGIEYNEELRIY